MAGPLDGIRVVEFTEIIAAPFAGMLLSDMGAEVIKVEPPWGDPWRTAYPFSETEGRPFLAYNRGKRDITLDLTSAESQGVLERLIPTADVVLANYRPDVAAKLGVDYETLARLNPRLIYCENTAFGRQGPDAHRPGYDVMLQAMSGLMAAEAKLDGDNLQHIISSPVIDTSAGFCLAWCVCGALFSRERTGRGQKIESTLLGTALALMGMRFFHVEELDRDNRAETLQVLDALRDAGVPFPELLEVYEGRNYQLKGTIYYRTFQTATGTIAVGCLSDPLRKRLLDVLGLHDIRFDDGYDPVVPRSRPVCRMVEGGCRGAFPAAEQRGMAGNPGEPGRSGGAGAFRRGAVRRPPGGGQRARSRPGTSGSRPREDGGDDGQLQRNPAGNPPARRPGAAHRRNPVRAGLLPGRNTALEGAGNYPVTLSVRCRERS